MMTAVAIPITAENYRSAPFDNDAIQGEVAEWCTSQTTDYWNWECERVGSQYQLVFRFSNFSDATKFKLTWA